MRMLTMRWLWTFALIAGLAGCNVGLFAPRGEESFVLRSGTSFGMCVGYCITEIVVYDGRATFTRSSRDPASHPATTVVRELTASEMEALHAVVASSDLGSSPEVYGCPDCADGGAEWVQIGADRVTLEHGADIESIRPLLRAVRELRARFDQSE